MSEKTYCVLFCGVLYYAGTKKAASKVKAYLKKKYPKVPVEIRQHIVGHPAAKASSAP